MGTAATEVSGMRYRIRKGAMVRQDFRAIEWEDEGVVFDVRTQGIAKPPPGWVWLEAPGYGAKGAYGNGPVLARVRDLIPLVGQEAES